MNYIRHLNGFFTRLAEDKRMTPYHVSLYFALFQQWNAERFGEEFIVLRLEIMELARIGSANTYARCMKELADWGYIRYWSMSNYYTGSRVCCIRFDTGNDIGRDTAGDTSRDTGNDTGNDTACDTGIGNDTGRDTGNDTSIKSDTGCNTGSDTGIITDTTSDTGKSKNERKNESASIRSDTGRDIGRDTLFINKNKQEEKSVRRNQKDDFNENEKKQKRFRTTNSENLPDEKFPVLDLSEVEQFFEQNQFPRSEAQKFYAHYQSSGWKTGDQMKIISWQAVARKWMNNTQSFKTDEREPNQIGTSKHSVTVNKDYSEPL
ncbi:MAG: hypothetical protein ACYC25_07265 [Paludibacter sp.]